MYMKNAMRAGLRRQINGRHGVRAFARSEFEIVYEFCGNVRADIRLRFFGRTTDVRR